MRIALIHPGFLGYLWILAMFLPVLDGCSDKRIKIDIWYGDSQSFGSPGNPQRAINILGNIQSDHPIEKLEYSQKGNLAPAILFRLAEYGIVWRS